MFRTLGVLLFGVVLAIGMVNGVAASGVNERMIAAINRYREGFGLPPLREDPLLMQVARERAPYYDHHALGQWSWEHCHRAGFVGPASDNLCQGAATPEEAVLDGWGGEDRDKHPAGHNYQMRGLMSINGRWVDQRFDSVGVAISGRNYIAIFGRSDAGKQYD
jgi:Cysteine-rich secretory protein family